jgi:hypothetical protein
MKKCRNTAAKFLLVLGEQNSAGLASAPAQQLAFDGHRIAYRFGSIDGLFDAGGHGPSGGWDSHAPEQGFPLKFI